MNNNNNNNDINQNKEDKLYYACDEDNWRFRDILEVEQGGTIILLKRKDAL